MRRLDAFWERLWSAPPFDNAPFGVLESSPMRRPKRRVRGALPKQCNTYTSSKAVPSDVQNDAVEHPFWSNATPTRAQKGINKCPPDARARDRRGPPAGERRDHFSHNILLTFYD